MSGLNSLLKYRFTRKTDKIHPDGDSKGDNSSQDSFTPPNSEGRVTPEITVLSVIETPKSQQPSPSSESPLIQRANTNGCSQSPVSSQETQNTEELEVIELESSGPWLSKKKASLLNGYNDALLKRTKISKLSHGRRRLKSESSASGDSDVETIDSSDSEDGADNKRKRSGDYGNGDSEVTGGQTKRRRVQLLSDSSEENGLPSQDQSLELSSQETIPNSQILEEQVNSMREMFPAATTEKIKSVLVEKNYNTDEAAQVLLAEVEELERSTSEKSKTSRHGRIVRTAGDDDDDDDAQPQGDDDDSDQEENSSERGPVLSFFESACLEELMSMPSCSRKKAEVIMGMRPFASWEDLVTKFQSTKTISYSLISRCWEIIQIREVVLRLMQRCEKISEKLGTMVASLAGQVTVNEFEDQIKTQPKILNPDLQMKPYQLVGLNWLRLMHSQELNGILADEMGLGKTVQAISFLSYLLELGDTGPHIIIVPSSTVENWLRELTRWCPDLQVVLYYGSQEERKRLRKEILYDGNDDYNIILTTYNMTSGSVDDRALFKTLEFHYAVFDEGHMLKNMTSQRYQHLQKIRAHRRLLLTGTPLQNNLLELMSLLCFVMPDMFVGKTESLKRMFTMITKSEDGRGEYEKERIANAKNIMKPFVLRRLKKDVYALRCSDLSQYMDTEDSPKPLKCE